MGAQSFLTRVSGKTKSILATLTGGSSTYAYLIPCLDAAGRLAESMMPTGFGANTSSGAAAEGLSAYKLVGYNSTGGVRLADAANAYPCQGFVKTAFSASETVTIYKDGTLTGFSSLEPFKPVYLSTAGGITQDVSTIEATNGAISQEIGWASSATTVEFNLQEAIYIAA